jgi:hypothetical protein
MGLEQDTPQRGQIILGKIETKFTHNIQIG